ncbi:hypothetical protein K1719_046197 [Acacia pycnantha]|nr:hypothetical protein K1719_046197 [Acacia pycnantha]
MLEKDIGKILEGTLSSAVDTRLKIQALQNMFEYLLDAEGQMETNKVKLKQGLKLAMSISGEGNGYLQETEFWRLYKENQPLCALVMKTAVGVVYLLACLLKPFMPSFTLEGLDSPP